MKLFRPVEPADGWHPGDLAYCVEARGDSSPLVAGRIYTVETVKVLANMLNCGLTFCEVRHPVGTEGFWSSRFLKLVRGHSFLKQIEAACEYPFFRPAKTEASMTREGFGGHIALHPALWLLTAPYHLAVLWLRGGK